MELFDLNNTHGGLSSVEVLYNDQQRVFLKSKKGEEKCRTLRINLDLKSGLTISLGKVLSLQITDDCDSTFFYSLLLSQEDFSILKCQQGLLVDFDHFPTQLIKLLDACKSHEFNKFILVLDEEDLISQASMIGEQPRGRVVFLKVIEKNNFKNLCHLSLKVVQGSDADVKNHMSSKIAQLTERLTEEEKKRRATETKLGDALRGLEEKSKEVTELQLRLMEEKNALRLEMSQQLSEEREKLSRVQVEWQQKLEAEKSQMWKQSQKQINELNDQINSLTFKNKNLYEGNCQLETSVKEKTFHIELLEKQNLQLTQEVNLLRKQNAQLDQDYHEKDKALAGLKTRLAVLEQELKDKVKYLEKQQELLKVANEQKTFLEEALNEKEVQLERKVAAIQTLTGDLVKSNEIIGKLQADLAANKAKMKLRTEIALEQEKILEKKTQELETQAGIIKELKEKVERLGEELDSLKTQLEEANKKGEEKELLIKKNENVISWLNRKLTESTSGLSSASTLITSSRSGSESTFGGGGGQTKGTVSNLAKNWPPWLANSLNGNATARGDTSGISTNGNSPAEASSGQQNEKMDFIEDSKMDSKVKGLDPKYFQSCTDKDYIVNPQVLKGNLSGKSTNCNTKANSSSRQPPSAYFPKKPITL